MFPIATQAVTTTGVTVLTFSNIPQTYKHLQLRGYSRSANSAISDSIYLGNFKGDSVNSNCAYHYMYATGGGVGVGAYTSQTYVVAGFIPAANTTSGIFGASVTDILDYTNVNKNKTIKSISGWDDNSSQSGQPYVNMHSGVSLYLGTSPMTSLSIYVNNSFAVGTRYDLYGITTSSSTGA
jgi:hypothetical protein